MCHSVMITVDRRYATTTLPRYSSTPPGVAVTFSTSSLTMRTCSLGERTACILVSLIRISSHSRAISPFAPAARLSAVAGAEGGTEDDQLRLSCRVLIVHSTLLEVPSSVATATDRSAHPRSRPPQRSPARARPGGAFGPHKSGRHGSAQIKLKLGHRWASSRSSTFARAAEASNCGNSVTAVDSGCPRHWRWLPHAHPIQKSLACPVCQKWRRG